MSNPLLSHFPVDFRSLVSFLFQLDDLVLVLYGLSSLALSTPSILLHLVTKRVQENRWASLFPLRPSLDPAPSLNQFALSNTLVENPHPALDLAPLEDLATLPPHLHCYHFHSCYCHQIDSPRVSIASVFVFLPFAWPFVLVFS